MRPSTCARTFMLLAAVLAAAVGCTSDSPTEPARPAPANPITPDPVLTYTVTVTANPPVVQIGSGNSSNITVQVTRNDNGQPPPDLTPVTLTTTLGAFGNETSGTQTVQLQLVGGQAQAVLFPGTSAGTATVQAQINSSSGAANVQIGTQSTFFISSVTPPVGNPAGGDEVTILGGGFDAPVRVTFGTAPGTVRSASADRIRVVVPSAIQAGVSVGVGQSVPVPVTVTINVNEPGQQSDSLANGFTYSLASSNREPQVFSVSPSSGTNDGGTRLTIVGQGFEAPVQVFFGQGTTANNFSGVEGTVESVTANQLVVVTPPARGFGLDNANQSVNLLVKNVNSGFSTVSSQAFRYGVSVQINSYGPGRAAYNVPTTVTIFGQGFDEPVAVGLGGFAAQVMSVSGSEIVVRSPVIRVNSCADVSGPVTVTNIETGDSDSTNGGAGPTLGPFTYEVSRPVVTGISPSFGTGAGGTPVTISGLNFTQPLRVLFGGQAGTVISTSSSQIVVQVPRFTGTFPTQPCDANGDGTQGQRDQPISVDVQVTNLETTCTDSLQQAFRYDPTDPSCRNDTGPPPAGTTQCSDGIDNDGDTLIDFGPLPTNDPQCTSAADNSEAT